MTIDAFAAFVLLLSVLLIGYALTNQSSVIEDTEDNCAITHTVIVMTDGYTSKIYNCPGAYTPKDN